MDREPQTRQTTRRRPGGRLKKLAPLALVLAAAAVVTLVAMMPNETPPDPPSDAPPVNVKVQRIQAIPELADTFDLTAVVEANRVVRVAAEVSGRIERIGRRQRDVTWRGRVLTTGTPLEEGDPISQGDPIVHLNEELLQARFERAQAQFNFDRIEHERMLDLFQRGTASKTEVDDTRTKRDVSKAELDEVAEELERATVMAPISGVLNRMPMEVGEYAVPGDCVAEIVDMDPAKVIENVPERDVHYLKVGDPAEIFVHAPDETRLTGVITYISELADESTRTTRLEITVDNPHRLLRCGQIVRARLTRRVLEDVIMIPLDAVIPLENGKAVYVVATADQPSSKPGSDGAEHAAAEHAERRDVEIGFLKGRSVRILSGLEVGDRLIVAGHRYVGPGQPVAVMEEE